MSNILEKLGLIEKEQNTYDNEDLRITQEPNEITIETTNFNEQLVSTDEVFKNAGYVEENNIYKIKEFKNALPQTMSNDLMKESILGVLKASNLDVNKLIEDGKTRIDILNQNIIALNQECEEYVNILLKEIEKLTEEINRNKEDINNKNIYSEKQKMILEDEINKINEIINFIE